MKTLLLIAGLIGCAISGVCQSKITGRIKDQQDYLPYASVVLRKDTIVAKATTTDSLGNFVLVNVPPGNYQLVASMVGYESYVSQPIEVGGETILLPEIVLGEASHTLAEIQVTSEKQWMDQQTDKTVINLEGSITSSGNTLLEVLQKSPGVVVNRQNSTISINGKSGVRIMINNKMLQVSPDVALAMLDGMNTSNIEKIEFILTPSSAYDADGAGGIIHIVTKHNDNLGTNGSITLTVGAKWAETIGGSMQVNHRAKNAAYFFDYSFLRTHNLHLMNMRRQAYVDDVLQTVLDSSYRENVVHQQHLNAGAEFKLSQNTMLKFLITGYKRDWRLDAESFSQQITTYSISKMSMDVWESNIWQGTTGSMTLQQKLNTKSSVDLTFDYLYYHNNNPSDYRGEISEDANMTLSKLTPIHIVVGKVDYRSVLSPSFSYDAGVKAVTSWLKNYVTVERLEGAAWVEDSEFTSRSSLDEQIVAGYIAAQWTTPDKWQVNSGLRYEHTQTSITGESGQKLIHRNYGYLFPSLSFRKSFSSKNEIYFAYTRRLTRPTYNDIASYVFFWGPGSFSAGNTALYPALSDGITTSYRLRWWTFSLQYTNTRNEIAAIQPEMVNENLVYTSQNLKYLSTLAFSSSCPLVITNWWEAQISAVAQYQMARTTHESGNYFTLYGLNLNMMTTVRLPKDFSVEVSATYQSRALSGVSQFLPMGSLNAGIQKKFGQGSTLKLALDDILYTNNWRIRTSSPENNLNVNLNYDWHNQYIRVAYAWTLGNDKLRSVKVNSSSDEERQRVN